jgi:hypothetical protein
MQAVEPVARFDAVREADLQDLDGIDRGAAADGEDEIRRRRAHRARRFDDARPRTVLYAAVEQPA